MFDYLIDKILDAPLRTDPFGHVYIEDYFSESHFREIIATREIDAPRFSSDLDLFDGLEDLGYKVRHFPGTTTEKSAYLKWHKNKAAGKHYNLDTCKGMGVTLRLEDAKSPILARLIAFFHSESFVDILCKKFDIDRRSIQTESGLQKYLDGYEISPHADERRKAATFMINVNPASDSETLRYHTEYMRFLPRKKFVQTFWEENPEYDRCWVPWDWCETVTRQTKNNSIVLFAPAADTIHAVKADYDHLVTQRTQFFGNLFYTDANVTHITSKPQYQDFIIKATPPSKRSSIREKIVALTPKSVRQLARSYIKSDLAQLQGSGKPENKRTN